MTDFDKRRAYAARSARATARRAGQAQCFDVLRGCYEAQKQREAERAYALYVGRKVIERARLHLDATWLSQDGRRTTVQGMSQPHLLFALAKGRRGEYEPRSWGNRSLEALECELLRRLAGVAGTDRQLQAHYREAVARESR